MNRWSCGSDGCTWLCDSRWCCTSLAQVTQRTSLFHWIFGKHMATRMSRKINSASTLRIVSSNTYFYKWSRYLTQGSAQTGFVTGNTHYLLVFFIVGKMLVCMKLRRLDEQKNKTHAYTFIILTIICFKKKYMIVSLITNIYKKYSSIHYILTRKALISYTIIFSLPNISQHLLQGTLQWGVLQLRFWEVSPRSFPSYSFAIWVWVVKKSFQHRQFGSVQIGKS